MTKHVDQMLEVMRDAKGQKPRLVHRLDRETSGCLLIAKTFCSECSPARSAIARAQNLLGAGGGCAEAEAGPHLDRIWRRKSEEDSSCASRPMATRARPMR
jgi:hypothetical protein